MFEDATFHSRGTLPNQAPKWMLLTLAINLATLTALIVLPLIYPQGLAPQFLRRILYAPPPQTAVVSQRVTTQSITQPTQPATNSYPIIRVTPADPSESSAPPNTGSIDLSPMVGAVPGGLSSSTGVFEQSTPRHIVKPSQPRTIAISRGVSEGLLISRTDPTYPAIARTTRTAGTVILAATISTTGHIENLQVTSGPPMLRQSAIDAVKTWRYRPYLLNNLPVETETTINIIFSLGSQ